MNMDHPELSALYETCSPEGLAHPEQSGGNRGHSGLREGQEQHVKLSTTDAWGSLGAADLGRAS